MIREISFNGNRIRIFDDGNIWVYATDIAKLLGGANNVTQLTRNLSDSDIKRVDGHRTIVINESGFYNMTAGKKNGSELRKFAEENIFKRAAPKEETGVTIYTSDQFGELRSIEKDGEIWFAAPDVCRVLDLTNPTKAVAGLDDDEKTNLRLGSKVEINFINEAGLYTLVTRSNKPNAKTFRRWVTHEVLPSIRKTGSYSVSPVDALQAFIKEYKDLEAKYNTLQTEHSNMLREIKDFADRMEKTYNVKPVESSYIHKNKETPIQFINKCVRSYGAELYGETRLAKGYHDFYGELAKIIGKDVRNRSEDNWVRQITEAELPAAVKLAGHMCRRVYEITSDETMNIVRKVLTEAKAA